MSKNLWKPAPLGGYLESKKMTRKLRKNISKRSVFRQFCEVKETESSRGETYDYTEIHTEKDEKGDNKFLVQKKSVVIDEYGISIPIVGAFDMNDAKSLKNIVVTLSHDSLISLERAVAKQLDKTTIVATPTNKGKSATGVDFSLDGKASCVNNQSLTVDHARNISSFMSSRGNPTVRDGYYVAIGRPTTFSEIVCHHAWEGVEKYSSDMDTLVGEIGRIKGAAVGEPGVIFVRQTVRRSDAWKKGKSDTVFFLGDGSVVEIMKTEEELRLAIPTNFGRNNGMMWYYEGAFDLIHSVSSSRVVKWGSKG